MSSIALGSTIIDALIGAGVTDVVLSPGSRSAALALAAHRADQQSRLRLHVRIDERVASFTALGLAKASGSPVAVITTSGTAVGNLVPAGMEASASGIPLIFISADRPAELVGTGASQTADQLGILGPAARATIRISSASGAPEAWVTAVQRAVAAATGLRSRMPGAVQINAEFVEPLVGPLPAATQPPFQITPSQGHSGVDLDARRTVVLVGDATPVVGAEARALAELSGAPLLAEPSSNARCGTHAIPAYRLAIEELGGQIDRVIAFGHPTLSRPVNLLLRRSDIELVAVTDQASWNDPGHRATIVTDRVQLADQDPAWLAAWQAFPTPASRRAWSQRQIADAVGAALGPDDDLVFGASSIIRAADLSPINPHPPRVFANRGLAGIDGTIATATGIALSGGRPTTVLLGDLTAQHDLGALVRPPGQRWPNLRVVVADDHGGSIFRTLEQAKPEYAQSFADVFLTPQGVDLAAVASALGWDAARVGSVDELERALAGQADFIVAEL